MNNEIIRLTNIWYDYVSLDHHKDRDCHFYVECAYSYGKPPKYYAYHNGYRMSDWTTPHRDTFEEAEKDLENKLRNEINSAILDLEMRIESDKEEWSIAEFQEELRALKGKDTYELR
jgi:hypothetical protein